MIPSTWNVHYNPIHRDRKQVNGCKGLGKGAGIHGNGKWCEWVQGFLWGWWKSSRTRRWWWLYNTVNVLNATELYTLKWLNRSILWHVDFNTMLSALEVGFLYSNSATSYRNSEEMHLSVSFPWTWWCFCHPLPPSTLNSQKVLSRCEQEKLVKCSISSYSVP